MEDDEIIKLYLLRNENAIYETNTKYGKYCSTIANNILYDDEDSKECVNDTYLNVWNAIPPKIPNIFKAFLGKITRNLALNMYEKKKSKKRNCETPIIIDELEDCIPSKDNVELKIEEKQLSKYINEFLESLPQNKRRIMVERYWYLNSIKNISLKYNLGQSNVKMTLLRLRKDLKKYLEERGEEI